MKRTLVTTILGLFVLLGCAPFEFYVSYPHYITDCLNPLNGEKTKIFPEYYTGRSGIHQEGKYSGYYFFDIFLGDKEGDTHLPKYENKEIEDYLISIGDNGFSGIRGGAIRYGVHALRYPVTGISIKCDKDLGKEHPAGSELNELFFVLFEDNYTFIKNGYKNTKGALKKEEHCTIRGVFMANDAQGLSKVLVPGANFRFYILQDPMTLFKKGDKAKFSVTVNFENGSILKIRQDIIFGDENIE